MSDVDDELLALVGNGSSSSRSLSPSRRRKRRRNGGGGGGDRAVSDDVDGSDNDDLDAEGSDDEGGGEAVNPFRLEGIYKDEQDRERLLDMPELEREAELAARRDLITQRRQKADLRAMVRNQQATSSGRRGQSARGAVRPAKKTRKLKKASAPRKARRRKADSDDDEEDEDEDEDDDDDDEEEEEEESDYESTRRGARTRKAVGKSSSKTAQLQKLRKSRAKAQRRKQGGGGDDSEDESSGAESESSYDAEEAEALWRRKKERERTARGETGKREVKQTREEERRKRGAKWSAPTLADVNQARLRRDHFTRLVHRPDWMSQLIGKFARINFTQKDGATGHVRTTYRLVQILDCGEGETYYEVSDQCTNVVCDMSWGGEKMRKVSLQFVSNSPVSQSEYDEWLARVDAMDKHKAQRSVPSHEATLDQADELDAFINRPFTEDDINMVLARKKQARDAFQAGGGARMQKISVNGVNARSRPQGRNNADGTSTAQTTMHAGSNGQIMAQMNERHRKAERERINEAERRSALAARLAAQKLSSKQATPVVETPPRSGTPLNGIGGGADVHASPALKPVVGEPTSLAVAAADVEVDLGDF